jgi:enoyl-[acyl-carrier-protein] reductase (NADH)
MLQTKFVPWKRARLTQPAQPLFCRQVSSGTTIAVIGTEKDLFYRCRITLRQDMSLSFTGKVALITGGTSGIGRATAVGFAQQGANVVVAGRREAEGAESVRLIEKTGGNGLFVRIDVTIEKEVEAVLYLCSPGAASITGVALPVDGGVLA